jgi:hypothetical protein
VTAFKIKEAAKISYTLIIEEYINIKKEKICPHKNKKKQK